MKRRTVLGGLAGAASTLAMSSLHAESKPSQAAPSCTLITQDITGPYYLDARQVRSDIADSKRSPDGIRPIEFRS